MGIYHHPVIKNTNTMNNWDMMKVGRHPREDNYHNNSHHHHSYDNNFSNSGELLKG